MSLQNMPLWHKYYFELMQLRNKSKKNFLLSSICLKAEHKFVRYSSSSLYQEGQRLIPANNFRSISLKKSPEKSI